MAETVGDLSRRCRGPTADCLRNGAHVHIRTWNFAYLQAVGGGGGQVNAQGPWPREWETFTLELGPGQSSLARSAPFWLPLTSRSAQVRITEQWSVEGASGDLLQYKTYRNDDEDSTYTLKFRHHFA